jgi:hypothetical protein
MKRFSHKLVTRIGETCTQSVRVRRISPANKMEEWKLVNLERFPSSIIVFAQYALPFIKIETSSSRGIVFRMPLTSVNISTGSPNIDPFNFLFSFPNSQKWHDAGLRLYAGRGNLVIPRRSKSRGVRCAIARSRWKNASLGRFRLRSPLKLDKTFSTTNSRSNIVSGSHRSVFSIPKSEKQTEIMTFFLW